VDEARVDIASPSFRGGRSPLVTSEAVSTAIGDTPISSHQLADGEWAVGRDLGALNLRAATGATVVAVRRGGDTVTPPPVNWQFMAGDVLYLVGATAALRQARVQLSRGPIEGRPRVMHL
jgi:K+/H+ antiporter YhaU regulatory subunit KhtT